MSLTLFILYMGVGIALGLVVWTKSGKVALFADGLITLTGFTFFWPLLLLLFIHFALKGSLDDEMGDMCIKVGSKVIWRFEK